MRHPVESKYPAITAGMIYCFCGEHQKWIVGSDLQICCSGCKRRYKLNIQTKAYQWEKYIKAMTAKIISFPTGDILEALNVC